jgi:hypothetical protein
LGQRLGGNFPQPIHISFEVRVEFSRWGLGRLDDGHSRIAQSLDHCEIIRIDLSQREDVLQTYTHLSDRAEKIDRLFQHVLDGDERCIRAKIKPSCFSTIQ